MRWWEGRAHPHTCPHPHTPCLHTPYPHIRLQSRDLRVRWWEGRAHPHTRIPTPTCPRPHTPCLHTPYPHIRLQSRDLRVRWWEGRAHPHTRVPGVRNTAYLDARGCHISGRTGNARLAFVNSVFANVWTTNFCIDKMFIYLVAPLTTRSPPEYRPLLTASGDRRRVRAVVGWRLLVGLGPRPHPQDQQVHRTGRLASHLQPDPAARHQALLRGLAAGSVPSPCVLSQASASTV